jgi:hypothetical protein
MPDGARPPSSRDVAGEEFLFHLYRGSEMLQDNRVHDAKAELEQALSLQPSDPKGQDLLAIVYFRLGLYPRAISIYERLVLAHPEAMTPRVNLALCYLKTGQAAQARTELERVLEANPGHSRAWGYLGLSFQRLGDYERASHAFAAGGHDAMARRLLEMAGQGAPSLRPAPIADNPEVRRAAGEAFQEIERDEGAFRPDDAPVPSRSPSGTWAAIEPGRERFPSAPSFPPPPPLSIGLKHEPANAEPASRPAASPPAVTELARELLVVFPRDVSVAQHPSGLVLVQAQKSFATRLELVRTMSYPSGFTTNALYRRMRGRTLDEPLGGPSSALVGIDGKGELVLAPSPGASLRPMRLDDEPLYLREDLVAGFEDDVAYENGRLGAGDGEAIPMLQLRGHGVVVAAFPEAVSALEVLGDHGTAVRAHAVLGWTGRLVPRALASAEAPGGARHYVAFAGEGMVLLAR